MSRGGLEVLTPGPLSTVQDLGRPGVAELGIGRSGAADRASFTLANHLVGNSPTAAGIETTFGGLAVQARGDVLVAAAGAPCPLRTTPDTGGACNAPFLLRHGQRLTVGRPRTGVRTYLAVRGGLDLEPVLGSRSTDLLAGIGPARLTAGSYLGVADDIAVYPSADRAAADPAAAVTAPPAGVVGLSVVPGPRDDWFTPDALQLLTAVQYQVSSESNRIGMRLLGPELVRARRGELPSEGLVPGSLQVPPEGRPTLLLADHPVTGGYPVIAVVIRADVDRAAQARPGQLLRFFPIDAPIRP